MTGKNPQKQGRILEGGGEFSGWPEYNSLLIVKAIIQKYMLTQFALISQDQVKTSMFQSILQE